MSSTHTWGVWLSGTLLLATLTLCNTVFAISYGGVGGQPAHFRPEVPKSKNIFIHTLVPGQVQEEGIIVHNLDPSGLDKVIAIHGVDTINSSGGSVACAQVLDEQKEVGTWIALEKNEITLSAQQKEEIPFTITVPEGIPAGEYNGCIVIQEIKSEERSGLSLSTRVGLRVALTVPGVLHREIVEPSVVMSIREDGGFAFQVSGRNTGNVSVLTDVSLKARSLLTGLLVFEQGGGYPVYRGKTQQWNFVFEKPFWGGPYLVTTQLSYDSDESGDNDVVLSAPNIFLFVVPAPLAIAIESGVILFLILLLIFLRRRRRRKQRAKHRDFTHASRGNRRNTGQRRRMRHPPRPRHRHPPRRERQ